MKHLYVAILAGGIGSRFWPKSRTALPKQFLDILNTGETLIQSTYKRFLKATDPDKIFVVTNEAYVPLVKEQLPDIDEKQILAEPMRKNTGPSIAYFTFKINQINPDATTIIAPADHLILHEEKFLDVIAKGTAFLQEKSALLTMGVKPTRPNTGYGYIQFIEEEGEHEVHKVKTFTEKPTLKLAKTFIKSGDFLWNSGIFMWKVKDILHAFNEHLHEVYEIFQEGKGFFNTSQEKAFVAKAFSLCSNISIDYAIMEKAENVYVIPAEFGWSDLGTWASLYGNTEKDYLGNAVSGKNVVVHDATECMIMAPDDKLVVLQGLKDFVVVDTEDVLLVFHKDKEQDLKQLVAEIRRKKEDKFF